MKIDAHQHFWNPARGDYGWMSGQGLQAIRKPFLPQDLAPLLAAHGISKTILVQAAPSTAETEYMLGLADATDFIAKVVGWIDFENRNDRGQLGHFARHPKFAGVRPMIQDLPDREWMHRKDIAWTFDAIMDLDLTFDALGFPLHGDPFRRLFDSYPGMRIVIDHALKPAIRAGSFDDWARSLADIASHTSALCKLSGLATEAATGWSTETLRPYVRHIIECFGANRVMWGSDWPVLTLNGDYESWLKTSQDLIHPSEAPAIFGTTAAAFYRVPARGPI